MVDNCPILTNELLKEIDKTQAQVTVILEQAVLRLIRQGTISQFDLPENSVNLLDKREDIFSKLGVLSI